MFGYRVDESAQFTHLCWGPGTFGYRVDESAQFTHLCWGPGTFGYRVDEKVVYTKKNSIFRYIWVWQGEIALLYQEKEYFRQYCGYLTTLKKESTQNA